MGVLFLSNGTLFAGLLPRYPEIKAQLALSNTAFGLSVAAFAAGALMSGLTAGALIRRFGSARVAVATSVLVALCTFAAGVAPTPVAFGGALFAAGLADAITDVAQNAHGLRVQRNYGRSIINSLHAVWSAGAVLGGLIGAGAIAVGVSRGTQLAATGALFVVACLVGYRFLLPGPDERARPRSAVAGAGPTARTWLVIGLLALLKEMVAQGAQFIIATHSPILMAFPDATIYSFDATPVRAVAYQDLEHVSVTREFLANPQRYLRHI